MKKVLLGFIWGRSDKIKRNNLVQQHYKDGLNMIHEEAFIKSMKLTLLNRLRTSNSDWSVLAAQELTNILLLLTYGSTMLKLLKSQLTNDFYRDLIESLVQFHQECSQSDGEILTEKVWFSDWTKFKTNFYGGGRFPLGHIQH